MVQRVSRRRNQAIRIVKVFGVAISLGCWVGVTQAGGADLQCESIAPDAGGQPRAIILLIGDGMGEGQRTAARWRAASQDGQLAMDAMPVSGWSRTGSADSSITDSAAAGTALSTGVKTNNGMISIDPYSNTLTTILEHAQARGMAVGLVTTVQMAHATPAVFASHVPSRYMMTEIANQTAFAAVPTTTTRLLGLFADEGMTRPFSPTLVQMTQKSIDILSHDPQGFFLMVEGGQIDWACHANDAANAITDTIDFDAAVAVAQSYASVNPDTLVIVTGDHETGGMSVALDQTGDPGEDGPFSMPDDMLFYVNWMTTTHTAADVPTTAQGMFSDLLDQTDENTYIYDVMYELVEPDMWLPLVLHDWGG